LTRLILAILPSNQDANRTVDGRSEMAHVAPLADAVLAECALSAAIVARVVTGKPESEDWPRGSLGGLRDQQKEAATWIATTRRPGDLSVSLNLHSDSGRERHCGYYYDGPGTVSEWLGRALADSIKGWFGGKVYSADYSAYMFARLVRHVACPVLLECGAHTMPADVAAVREHADDIALAIVDTLVSFFGIEASPPLDVLNLRMYADWSVARLMNGEDCRDVAAFRRHLDALGCDPSDLRRYGVPV
jgi:hypothetical protein